MISNRIPSAPARVICGCATALLLTFLSFRLHFNLSSATSVHLFLVILIALRWGLVQASLASVLSIVCLDYFFTDPLFHFYVTDSHDWVALAVFEATALLVSSLSSQTSRHARELERRETQQKTLYELSQRVLLLNRDRAADQQLVELIRSSLHIEGAALWNAYEMCQFQDGVCSFTEEQMRGAYFCEANQDDEEHRIAVRVLRLGTRPIGSLCLYGHALDTATVNAVAVLVAVAIERARSFQTETSAEAAKQSEQLRSSILDGLAHAFKSPLTTIRTSSSGLLAMNTLAGTEEKLVTLIDRHASQLSDLTTHLLLTAKLDGTDLRLKRERLDLTQLIRHTVEDASHELDGHPVTLNLAPTDALAYVDRKLVQMALFQILDNAAKYSSPESPVVIGLRSDEAESIISVRNEGSFIPDGERPKVFQRFYRCAGSTRSISGTGIGLSVVKRITEAHHGRTWVESDPDDGTTFAISFPRVAKERK